MPATVGNLLIDLRLNTAKFAQAMGGVERRLQGFSRGLGRLAAAAGVGFGAGIVRELIATNAQLDAFANRIGVSASELQAWQLIAERFNVSTGNLNTGLQRLTRRAAEAAEGTGEARGALRELGIDAQRFVQLPLDQRMFEIAEAFGRVEDRSARLRLAFKLFDTEGTSFLQFLNQGGDALRKVRQEVDGLLLDDADIQKLARLDQELVKLGQTLQTNFSGFAADAVGGVNDLITALGEAGVRISREFQDRLGGEDLREIVFMLRQQAREARKIKDEVEGTTITVPTAGAGIRDFSRDVEMANQALEEGRRELLAKFEADEEAFTRFLQEEDLRRVQNRNAIADKFTEVFTLNMVQAAEGGFDSILKSWTRTLQQMAARALASQLFKVLANSPIGGAIENIFGGARASGGPVRPGRAFLVGERGPELFVPGQAGSIVPGAGMALTVVNNNTFNGNAGTPADQARFAARISDATVARVREQMRNGRF